jgi:TrmH family RNA methyltransferase
MLIDGAREIALAWQAGIELETIFVGNDESSLAAMLAVCGSDIAPLLQPVSAKVLEKICYGQRATAPVAVAITPQRKLSAWRWSAPELWVVFDQTEKPGNLGACMRTASACGVAGVILSDPVCEPFNPNAIRASRGTIFTVPLLVTSRDEFQASCRDQVIPVWTARVEARESLWSEDFRGGGAIVFGSEANGLGSHWRGSGCRDFTIPMKGASDSLNLSISAAVTMYESLRQRQSML